MPFLFFVFILLNDFSISPGNCRKMRENKNPSRRENPHEDVDSIRQIFDHQLPRRALVDVLHKGQHFQDIFSEHLEPLKIQFGHVCENPHEWEQRFERKDLKNNQHQGKVRWGNKNGGYGEHYWDLNHGQ